MFSHQTFRFLLHAVTPELRSHDPGQAVRLPEPDSAAMKRFVLSFLMVVLCVLFAAMLRSWRRDRVRKAKQSKKHEEFLARRGLTAQEKALLAEVIRSSEEPAERVVKLVLSFDRGIDRYLADLPQGSDEEHLALLRRLKSLRAKLELDRVPPGVPLLSTREIQAGQEFLFRFSTNPRGKVYAGVLLGSDDTGLLVEVRSETVLSRAGEEVGTGELDVYFLRRNDGGYRFRSRMLADVGAGAPGGEKAIWHLAHPRKLSREQRRHYLRIPVHEDVSFALVPTAAQASAREACNVEALPLDRTGTIVDLSGGGFRLVSEGAPVEPEDVIVLRLPFVEVPLDRELLVARAMKIYKKSVEFGFTFEDLPSSASCALVRHVEAVHRQLRCVV